MCVGGGHNDVSAGMKLHITQRIKKTTRTYLHRICGLRSRDVRFCWFEREQRKELDTVDLQEGTGWGAMTPTRSQKKQQRGRLPPPGDRDWSCCGACR